MCVRVCVQCAWTDVSAVAYTISALCIHYSAPIGERSIVMTVHVYVCLSVRDHIFGTTCPIFTDFFMRVPSGGGSVLLWRRNDTLCTSSFMDYVTFAHKSRLLDVAAQLKRSAHAALGLAINCAQYTSCRPTDAHDYFSGA